MSGKDDKRKGFQVLKGGGKGGDPYSSAYNIGSHNSPISGEHRYYTEDFEPYYRRRRRNRFLLILFIVIVLIALFVFFPR